MGEPGVAARRGRSPATPELGVRFEALVDPLRFPAGGVEAAVVKEVRRLKARMESERLPRGLDPAAT